jgi:putative MATE family efflux protein
MFDISSDDITTEPVHRVLLVLTGPLLVQNVVRMVEQIVDLFWVGHYSGAAVAAIGLAGPIFWLLFTSLVMVAFTGTQVLVSQRVGADNQTGARRAAFTGLSIAIVSGLAVAAIMFFGVEHLVGVVVSVRPEGATGNVPRLAVIYLRMLALGVVFAAVGDVIEASFLGRGDSRAPLYLNVTTVGVNLTLDPVLIFGLGPVPQLGMYGAGLASVGGWVTSLLVGIVLAARGRAGWIVTRESGTFDWSEYREFLDIGLPQGVQAAAGTCSTVVMTVAVFGVAGGPGLTAFTVGSRFAGLASRATSALEQATQSVVGQNLGADFPERAHRSVVVGGLMAGGSLSLVAVAVSVAPGPLVRVLVPDIGPRAYELATSYLEILAYGFPAMGVLALLRAGLNGARKTKTTMVAGLIQKWGVQVPIAVVGGLLLGGGILFVFWARVIGIVTVVVGLGAYYVSATRSGLLDRAAEQVESASD